MEMEVAPGAAAKPLRQPLSAHSATLKAAMVIDDSEDDDDDDYGAGEMDSIEPSTPAPKRAVSKRGAGRKKVAADSEDESDDDFEPPVKPVAKAVREPFVSLDDEEDDDDGFEAGAASKKPSAPKRGGANASVAAKTSRKKMSVLKVPSAPEEPALGAGADEVDDDVGSKKEKESYSDTECLSLTEWLAKRLGIKRCGSGAS